MTPARPAAQCSKFHSGRVILLGDSAHAVTSTLGQGCNTALESCAVLDSVLDRTSTPEQVGCAARLRPPLSYNQDSRHVHW